MTYHKKNPHFNMNPNINLQKIENHIKELHPQGRLQRQDNLIWVYVGDDKPIVYDINYLNYILK
jgi:hypothetical protein